MSVGKHVVTVSASRSPDPWREPVNTNPYFLNDASGWQVRGGTMVWENGAVTVQYSFLESTATIPYAGQRMKWRAAFTIPPDWPAGTSYVAAGPLVNVVSHAWSGLSPGDYVLSYEHVGTVPAGTTTMRPYIVGQAGGSASNTYFVVDSFELFYFDETYQTPADLSCLCDEIDIRHGRDDPTDQPEASTATIALSWNGSVDTVPTELEVGAVVNVSTAYPIIDPITYAWTGAHDQSRSSRTSSDGVLLNDALNPEFRIDARFYSHGVGWAQTWQATGGVDDSPYGRCVYDGTTAATGSAGGIWQLSGSKTPTAGSVACWDFWARPVGGMPGVRVTFGTSASTVTLASYTFNGTDWQHFAGRATAPTATNGNWYLTAPTGYAPLVGNGIDLDRIACVFLPSSAWESPGYFDGDTANVSQPISTRFTGRVTDLNGGWDDTGENTPDAATMQVVCAGFSADLGRRIIGDAPFPQELDGARVNRIFALANVQLDPFTSDPGTVQILPRDIDSQPALEVALETADDAGGILWYTRDGYIRYADSEHRRGTQPALALDACDIGVSPTWQRNTQALVNKVSVGYGATPDEGEQTRWIVTNDPSIERYGLYASTGDTSLATLVDAQTRASLLLARNSKPAWVLNALPVDVDHFDEARGTALLNLDMHSLITVTGLPSLGSAPTSAAMWVEGWTEHLAYNVHTLEIAVSDFARTAPPTRWNDVDPEATWDTITPSELTWDDAVSLGPKPSLGRWDDVSATTRWQTISPSSLTWDEWK